MCRHFLTSLCLVLLGCTAPEEKERASAPYGWARLLEDRSVSRYMETAISRITLGDERAWKEVTGFWEQKRLDGIAAECYLTALGELYARCPTVFLERHLAGDKSAKYLAREGHRMVYASEFAGKFGFRPDAARENAVSMFRQRASIGDALTKNSVRKFIAFIEAKDAE